MTLNTLSKKRYIFESVLWIILFMICYRNVLFSCLEDMSYSMSEAILWGIVILFCGIGMLITWKKGRNNLNIFINIALPFEIYTVIVYHKNIPTFMNVTCIIAIVLSMTYIAVGIIITIKDDNSNLILHRIKHSLLGARAIFTFCLLAIFVFFTINIIVSHSLFPRTVKPVTSFDDENEYLIENIDTLYNFTDDKWSKLSTTEKLNSLQVLANIEQNKLGINHKLTVVLNPTKEATMAFYNHSTQEILVNIKYFNKDYATAMMVYICHEARHAWQHQLCEIYDELGSKYGNMDLMRQAKQFEAEFENYEETDYDKYSKQLCEIDATDYSKEEAIYYYKLINNIDNDSKEDS